MLQGLGLYLKNISFLFVGFDAWRLDKMYMYTTKFLHHFISQVWEDELSRCHRPFGILLFDYIPILLWVYYHSPPFLLSLREASDFFGGAKSVVEVRLRWLPTKKLARFCWKLLEEKWAKFGSWGIDMPWRWWLPELGRWMDLCRWVRMKLMIVLIVVFKLYGHFCVGKKDQCLEVLEAK